ncbi:unnamed protein product [Mycena citricolor]|uniref:DUF6593 domain-containing protein n=1 Tax=Mycena citricolor TaxID=2018698 RepID=A0AAD2K2I9_9AGAR|nr:unnamed protein product [Mycena citricolor]
MASNYLPPVYPRMSDPQQNTASLSHHIPMSQGHGTPQSYGMSSYNTTAPPPDFSTNHHASSALPPPPHMYPSLPPQQHQEHRPRPPSSTSSHPGGSPGFVPFTFSGVKKHIRDSRVTDAWGQTVMTVASTKKESTFHNMRGELLAIFEWNHHLPRILYRGTEIKSKDFLPLDRKALTRTFAHQGHHYVWKGTPDESAVELYNADRPDHRIGYWHNEDEVIILEATPELYQTPGLLDFSLLSVFLMNCGAQIEERGGGGPSMVLIGALSALINAA